MEQAYKVYYRHSVSDEWIYYPVQFRTCAYADASRIAKQFLEQGSFFWENKGNACQTRIDYLENNFVIKMELFHRDYEKDVIVGKIFNIDPDTLKVEYQSMKVKQVEAVVSTCRLDYKYNAKYEFNDGSLSGEDNFSNTLKCEKNIVVKGLSWSYSGDITVEIEWNDSRLERLIRREVIKEIKKRLQ